MENLNTEPEKHPHTDWPSHLTQMTFFCSASLRVEPLYMSSRLTFIWWTTSFPRRGPCCRRPPPPKNMSKMSMGEWKSKPLPLPPPLMASSPPRSYVSRFLGSAKTSYAWLICLNWKCGTSNEQGWIVSWCFEPSQPLGVTSMTRPCMPGWFA